MREDHLVVSCTVDGQNNKIHSHVMIDDEANDYSFVDEDFARCHNLPLFKLKNSRTLEVFDGRIVESGEVTHITKIRFTINEHVEYLSMFVTKLDHYLMILRLSWLRRHDVRIEFAVNTVIFDFEYCL